MTWILWSIAIFGYLIIAIITFNILDKHMPVEEDPLLALFWPLFILFAPIRLWLLICEKIHNKHLKQLEEKRYREKYD